MSKCIYSYLKTTDCFFSPDQTGETNVNSRNGSVSADRLSPSPRKIFLWTSPDLCDAFAVWQLCVLPHSTKSSRELCPQAAVTSRGRAGTCCPRASSPARENEMESKTHIKEKREVVCWKKADCDSSSVLTGVETMPGFSAKRHRPILTERHSGKARPSSSKDRRLRGEPCRHRSSSIGAARQILFTSTKSTPFLHWDLYRG